MTSSETAGRPGRPRRLERAPSFITPAPASEASSQWSATTTPSADAYSMALRMRPASAPPAPSSVKILTPLAASSAIGANLLPSLPTVRVPAGRTSAQAPLAASRTWRTTPAQSAGGCVLGMATTAVKPPSAAARAPVSMDSASSPPGSRRWQCKSTRPGATMQPVASSTVAPAGADSPASSMAATTSPFTSTSARLAPVASRTVPPATSTWRSRGGKEGPRAQEEVQDSHAHRNPARNLGRYERRGAVGDLGRDLYAPPDGPRVHDEGAWAEQARALGGEPVGGLVLAGRGEELALHALGLDAQQVHHVALGQQRAEVVAHLRWPALEGRRQEGWGRDQCHRRPERAKGEHARTGHSAVTDVPHDRHLEPFEVTSVSWARAGPHGEAAPAPFCGDRVAVEESLGRVLVGAVSRVHDRCRTCQPTRHLGGDAGTRVAHHERVHPHRFEGEHGVAQRLTLVERTGRGAESDDIGREAFGRQFETEARPGRVLEKGRADRLPPQRRHAPHRPREDLGESCRQAQHLLQPLGA